jgi:hypothetical protein
MSSNLQTGTKQSTTPPSMSLEFGLGIKNTGTKSPPSGLGMPRFLGGKPTY